MMNKLILVFFPLVFVIATLFASAQPRLEMVETYDFGTVAPPINTGKPTKVRTDIEVKNTGDSTLIITSSRVQCGCTETELESDTILPRSSTILHLVVTLPPSNGVLSKYFTLFTNEPTNHAHALQFTVDVQRALQLGSGFLAFNVVAVGDTTHATMTVFVNQKGPATIEFKDLGGGLSVYPSGAVVVKGGDSIDFHFTYVPKSAGHFEVKATLQCDIEGYDDLELLGFGSAN